MRLRDKLNNNPLIAGGAVVAVLAAAVYFAFTMMRPPQVRASTQLYFTTDDGATLFLDDRDLIPPFTHDGKEAVRAAVFTCDGGKTHFIGYLEKFTPEYKVKREAAPKQVPAPVVQAPAATKGHPAIVSGPPAGGPPALSTLLKKPGGKDWVPMIGPEGIKIQQENVCPNGSDQKPERIEP